ncbi:MAG: hemolysin III family protein, partial [Actinobacteria bacterium]|nr:hemolysin III family protein [Actinomycetota bacterium]
VAMTVIIWSLAAAGIAAETFWLFRPRWVNALIYLCMGWLIIFKIGALVALVPIAGVWLFIAGGAFYTLGTIFYILKKVPYMHSIWHIFVLGGSVCHFLAVLLYVL